MAATFGPRPAYATALKQIAAAFPEKGGEWARAQLDRSIANTEAGRLSGDEDTARAELDAILAGEFGIEP